MEIRRRPPRHPRRGPSCLLVLTVIAAFIVGAYVVSNAEEVRGALTPDPTPTPTKSAAAHALSGQLYARDGESDNAIVAYRAAINLAPEQVSYYLPLIDLLVRNKETEEALELADRVVAVAPDNDEVWRVKAAAHLANAERLADRGRETEEEFAKAIEAAEAATRLNPENAEAYAYLATAYVSIGSQFWGRATESAETAYSLAPLNPIVLYHYGQVYINLGYYESAQEMLELAKEVDPNNTDTYIALSTIYFFYTGERARALLTVRDAIEREPTNSALHDLMAYYNLIIGEYAQAQAYAEDAVKYDPDMVRAHAHLGHAFYKQFNYPNAIRELELAVDGYGQPTNITSIYFAMLGLAYYFQDEDGSDCFKAVPLFEQALDVSAPDSPGEISAAEGLELCRRASLNQP